VARDNDRNQQSQGLGPQGQKKDEGGQDRPVQGNAPVDKGKVVPEAEKRRVPDVAKP
jgi:hypothetical protein